MPTIGNALNCRKFTRGTGLTSCEIRLRQPKSVLRVVDGSWTFDPATEEFNRDYVISKIQDGTFVPFLNTVEFTNNTGERTSKDYQDGGRRTIRNAKPDYMLEWDNGIGFHKSAYSLNGQDGSVIMIDKVGNVFMDASVSGDMWYGFETTDFNTDTYMPEAGDETPKTLVSFMIADEESFNRNMVVITVDEVGSNLNREIKGIIDATIAGTSTTTAANFTVNAINNSTFGIEGLDQDNFRAVNVTDNAVVTFSAVSAGATPGSYVGTYTAPQGAGDKITIELYDTVAAEPVALIEPNRLYRGVSAEITVTA